MDNNQLYHYGIKGMRWGVRRFQNEDGSLTRAGKRREKATTKYINKKDISLDQANDLYDRRQKILKIGVAATATALIAIGAYKIKASRADMVLKKGQKIQRVISRAEAKTKVYKDGTVMYTTHDKLDNRLYKDIIGPNNLLRPTIHPKNKAAYIRQFELSSNLKKASDHNAKVVFNKLRKTAIREGKSKIIFDHGTLGGKYVADLNNMSYRKFNRMLGVEGLRNSTFTKSFFSSLEKRGYSALSDLNDKSTFLYEGIHAKDPLIMFGKTAKSMQIRSTKLHLSSRQLYKEVLKERNIKGNTFSNKNIKFGQQWVNKRLSEKQANAMEGLRKARISETKTAGSNLLKGLSIPAMITGLMYGLTGVDMSMTTGSQVAIDSYKQAHPGTKMSDAEIAEMLYNK